jgi:hypothetical protein
LQTVTRHMGHTSMIRCVWRFLQAELANLKLLRTQRFSGDTDFSSYPDAAPARTGSVCR